VIVIQAAGISHLGLSARDKMRVFKFYGTAHTNGWRLLRARMEKQRDVSVVDPIHNIITHVVLCTTKRAEIRARSEGLRVQIVHAVYVKHLTHATVFRPETYVLSQFYPLTTSSETLTPA
jgi:hypothetical protein